MSTSVDEAGDLNPQPLLEPSLLKEELAKAAVAIILCRSEEDDLLLLTRRLPRSSDPWSGTWALPGGKRDHGDPDLVETAIREAREECGITLTREDLVESLEVREAGRPGYLIPVAPFVFRLPGLPVVEPNPMEVAEIRWLPLGMLREPRRHRRTTVPGQPPTRFVPSFDLSPVPLWGFTYRLLCDWLAITEEE